MLHTHFREELDEPVAREFDQMYATLTTKFYKEHNEDGSHKSGEGVSVMTNTAGLRVVSGPFTIDDVNASDPDVAGIRPNDLPGGTYHDFAPPGIHTAYMIDLEPTGDVVITGIHMGTVLQKRFLKFRNRDSGSLVTFPHEHTGSLEQHRFENPGGKSFYLYPRQTVELYYDPERKRLSPVVGPALVADVYTPNIVNGANVASSVPASCQYLRINGVVTVSGSFAVDPVADSTRTTLELSLPVPAVFAGDNYLAGTMASQTTTVDSGPIYGNTSSYRAQFDWLTRNSGPHTVFFIFTYRLR